MSAHKQTQMAESKSDPTTLSLSDKEVKAPNVFERVKEEIGAVLHTEKSPYHHHETHGKRTDIDENTPLQDVRAPNVFERAKEELEALVTAVHPKKESPIHERSNGTTAKDSKEKAADSLSGKEVKAPNLLERAKEEIDAILHTEKSPKHHKETHGMRDDIDKNTGLDDVKAPNVFERTKEEFEALVQTIHPKKESPTHERSDDNVKAPNIFERAKEEIEAIVETIHPKKEHTNSGSLTKEEDGCISAIGRGLEKVCSPRGSKKDSL